MTIGGKINCDQIAITCDYFSGQIDFIKITKAANLNPTAAYASSCFGLGCTFDSSASADADGSLTRFAWDFGDGQTSTAANPSHTYAAPGVLQRPAHGDRQPVRHGRRDPLRQRRGRRPGREPHRVRRVCELGGQQQQPDGDRPGRGRTW